MTMFQLTAGFSEDIVRQNVQRRDVSVVDDVVVIMRIEQCIVAHHVIANWQTGRHALPQSVRIGPIANVRNYYVAPNVTISALQFIRGNELDFNKTRSKY